MSVKKVFLRYNIGDKLKRSLWADLTRYIKILLLWQYDLSSDDFLTLFLTLVLDIRQLGTKHFAWDTIERIVSVLRPFFVYWTLSHHCSVSLDNCLILILDLEHFEFVVSLQLGKFLRRDHIEYGCLSDTLEFDPFDDLQFILDTVHGHVRQLVSSRLATGTIEK